MSGSFITFEGGEGAGKSTQLVRVADRLSSLGYDVVTTREPGGTSSAESIREILLSGAAKDFGAKIEFMLFCAARADHVDSVIRPALSSGKIVLCDRFMDSSRVYQGIVGGVDMDFIKSLENIVTKDAFPDLTIIFDLPPTLAKDRMKGKNPDRFEKDDIKEQESRRAGFLQVAESEPKRCVVLDASQELDMVSSQLDVIIDEHLSKKNG